MKLYTTPGACSLADHIVLEWIGEPYEAVIVSKEERGLPAYLAINPNGAVPALDDGGWVLTQNAAILNYLADLYPASGLGGDGSPRSRAARIRECDASSPPPRAWQTAHRVRLSASIPPR